MQSIKIVALLAFLCAVSVYETEAQYAYAPAYWPSYAYPYSYLNPYGRYYAYAPSYVIGKRSAGFGPEAPTEEHHLQ